MSRDIKEIIFDENSTLFQVLDQLDITEIVDIRSKTNKLEGEVSANKTQLDALAIKQDNFEGTTNAKIIAVNTKIEQQDIELSTLNNSVKNVETSIRGVNDSLEEQITRLDSLYQRTNEISSQVDQLNKNVTQVGADLSTTNKEVDTLKDDLNNLNRELSILSTNVSSLQSQQIELGTRVTKMQDSITKIDQQIVTGVRILKNTDLFVWEYKYGRITRFTYTGPDEWMLMGKVYQINASGWLNGSQQIRLAPYNSMDGWETPRSYTVPATSGTVYDFAYGNFSDSETFPAYIYT